MSERAQGKIPPGIYLRDIAEVREGAESFQFTENKTPPRNVNNCLSLVGSERTISLELPSKVRILNMYSLYLSFFSTCNFFFFCGGVLSITFSLTRTPPICLSNQFTRDWFLTRFRLLAEDILVEQERASRQYRIWDKGWQLNSSETEAVAKLQGLLERGVQVLNHEPTGKVIEAVLSYSSVSNDLELYSRQDGIFSSKETKAVRVF